MPIRYYVFLLSLFFLCPLHPSPTLVTDVSETPLEIHSILGTSPEVIFYKADLDLLSISIACVDVDYSVGTYSIQYYLSYSNALKLSAVDTDFSSQQPFLSTYAFISIDDASATTDYYIPLVRLNFIANDDTSYIVLLAIPRASYPQYSLYHFPDQGLLLTRYCTLNNYFKNSIDGYRGFPGALLNDPPFLYRAIPDSFRIVVSTKAPSLITNEEAIAYFPTPDPSFR